MEGYFPGLALLVVVILVAKGIVLRSSSLSWLYRPHVLDVVSCGHAGLGAAVEVRQTMQEAVGSDRDREVTFPCFCRRDFLGAALPVSIPGPREAFSGWACTLSVNTCARGVKPMRSINLACAVLK